MIWLREHQTAREIKMRYQTHVHRPKHTGQGVGQLKPLVVHPHEIVGIALQHGVTISQNRSDETRQPNQAGPCRFSTQGCCFVLGSIICT